MFDNSDFLILRVIPIDPGKGSFQCSSDWWLSSCGPKSVFLPGNALERVGTCVYSCMSEPDVPPNGSLGASPRQV